MSERPLIEQMRRARTVADAPIEALLAGAEELARRWIIAMLSARQLAEIAELPLEQLAREAPSLCEQLLRALSSDVELERLIELEEAPERRRTAQTPARTLALLPGAPSATVLALDLLRGVIWRGALDQLSDDPPVALVADLAERLAFVCAALLARSLDSRAGASAEAPLSSALPQPPRAARAPYGRSPSGARGRPVLLDELAEEPRPLASPGYEDDAPELEASSAPGEASGHEASSASEDAHQSDRLSALDYPSVAFSSSAPRSPSAPRELRRTDREDAPRSARPRPWDTPLGEAPAISPGSAVDRGEPQIHLRRGSGAQDDERE